jgi:hypothetical protein
VHGNGSVVVHGGERVCAGEPETVRVRASAQADGCGARRRRASGLAGQNGVHAASEDALVACSCGC